jgi:integrase/recombinase XerD
VVNLHIKDVSGEHEYRRLRILGKGNKERILPLPNVLDDIFDAYIQERKVLVGDCDHLVGDTLFITTSLVPFTVDHFRYVVKVIVDNNGLLLFPKGAFLHALRHTFATVLVDNGVSVPELATLLGHKSISTTQRYLDSSANANRSIVNTSPIATSVKSSLV